MVVNVSRRSSVDMLFRHDDCGAIFDGESKTEWGGGEVDFDGAEGASDDELSEVGEPLLGEMDSFKDVVDDEGSGLWL